MELIIGNKNAIKGEMVAEVIRQFGRCQLRVTGTSMLPAVWPGDVITIVRRSAAELLIGQIAFCYRNRTFTAHRFVRTFDDIVVTRGDALSYEDPPFHALELLGEVVTIFRDGRPVALSSAWWHDAASKMVRHSHLFTRVLVRMRGASKWVQAL